MNQQNQFETALELHQQNLLADAEILYRQILNNQPQHFQARHYLGVLLHQTGNSQNGISLIQEALDINGQSADRYNDLGNIYAQMDKLPEALTAFRQALDLNPDDANIWNNFGAILQRQNNLADAEQAYRTAIRLNENFTPALENLASILQISGRDEESSHFYCLVYIQPPYSGKSLRALGAAYYRLGRTEQAAEIYQAWLDAEQDNPLAAHYLAACSGKPPDKASTGFVQTLFDEMAETFDEKLLNNLGYRGPAIFAQLLASFLTPGQRLQILDAGCGTGLCAPALKPYARQLTGIDLSTAMLEKAEARNAYDQLIATELSDYLRQQAQAFDLILMADTLIYFGNLDELFGLVSKALLPGGYFCFSVESSDEGKIMGDYFLAANGRYCHNQRYISNLLAKHGFHSLHIEDAALRREYGRPSSGLLVLAQIL